MSFATVASLNSIEKYGVVCYYVLGICHFSEEGGAGLKLTLTFQPQTLIRASGLLLESSAQISQFFSCLDIAPFFSCSCIRLDYFTVVAVMSCFTNPSFIYLTSIAASYHLDNVRSAPCKMQFSNCLELKSFLFLLLFNRGTT